MLRSIDVVIKTDKINDHIFCNKGTIRGKVDKLIIINWGR